MDVPTIRYHLICHNLVFIHVYISTYDFRYFQITYIESLVIMVYLGCFDIHLYQSIYLGADNYEKAGVDCM